MNTQHSCGLLTAGVLAGAVIGLAPQPASAQAIGQVIKHHHDLAVVAVGCIQSEKDYRRAHDSGRGGFLRTGAGDNDEYILVNATVGVPQMHVQPVTEAESANCLGSSDNGQAIELTGHPERDLAPFVGRRVVLSGMLKHAKDDPQAIGTSGDFTPLPTSGGIDITGAELELREINVDSFALAPVLAPRPKEAAIAPPAPAPATAAPAPPPEPAAEVVEETAVVAEVLPKTASPLPAIGLMGLLSLAGAFGLRFLGRVRLS